MIFKKSDYSNYKFYLYNCVVDMSRFIDFGRTCEVVVSLDDRVVHTLQLEAKDVTVAPINAARIAVVASDLKYVDCIDCDHVWIIENPEELDPPTDEIPYESIHCICPKCNYDNYICAVDLFFTSVG